MHLEKFYVFALKRFVCKLKRIVIDEQVFVYFTICCIFEVFVGRIPRTVFEDELVPLLEQAGTIWDFRLMMDPLTGQNRGFGFVSYTNKDEAAACVKKVILCGILSRSLMFKQFF